MIARVFLVSACLALVPRTVLARVAVTPGSETKFQKVIQAAEAGRAGQDVNEADVSIEQDSIRIDLMTAVKARRTLHLRPVDAGAKWHDRFFAIELGDGATPDDAEHLKTLLDEAFDVSPFVPESDGMDGRARDAPAVREAWQSGGMRGAMSAVSAQSRSPAGPGYATLVLVLHALGVLACLVLVWTGAVERSREDPGRPPQAQ
jgi:hypothetical protein